MAPATAASASVAGWLLPLVAGATVAMLLEALVLLAWHRRTGAGLAPRALLPTLAAGGALMAALLALVAGAPPLTLPLLLAVAGVAHGLDLRRRWSSAAPRAAAATASPLRRRARAPAGNRARGRRRTTRR